MGKSQFSRRALDLCLAIYRVTAKFPTGEVLARQMRELGNQVIGCLAEGDFTAVAKKIDCLQMYFQIAQAQNWVKPINWSILDSGYYKLQQEAILAVEDRGFTRMGNIADSRGTEESEDIMSHNIEKGKKKRKYPKSDNNGKLLVRQEKLLNAIKDNDLIKMSGLTPLLKDIASERTIRNDLRELLDRNLINKDGINKSARYSINPRTMD